MQMNPRDITRADALRFLAPYQGKFCVCSSLAISVFFQVLFGDEVAVRFVVAERYSAARRVNFELETHFVQGARARVNLHTCGCCRYNLLHLLTITLHSCPPPKYRVFVV